MSGRIASERKQAMTAMAKRQPGAQWKHVWGGGGGSVMATPKHSIFQSFFLLHSYRDLFENVQSII